MEVNTHWDFDSFYLPPYSVKQLLLSGTQQEMDNIFWNMPRKVKMLFTQLLVTAEESQRREQ